DSATGKITLPWTSNQNKNITYSYNELGGEITANVTQPVEFTHSEGIWSKKGYFITYPKQIPLNNKNSEKEFHINLFNMDGKMTPYNGTETVHLQVNSQNNFKLIDSLNPLASSIPYKVNLGTVELSSGSQTDLSLSAKKNNLLGKVKVLEEKLDTNVYDDTWQISLK
uniref:DUF775 domain-containing protein n=1 Tax=Lactococcus garvieae TaxID=1363 RepID=UPI002551B9FA